MQEHKELSPSQDQSQYSPGDQQQQSPYGTASEFPILNDSTTINAQTQEQPFPGGDDQMVPLPIEGEGDAPKAPAHRKQSLFRAQSSEGSMGKLRRGIRGLFKSVDFLFFW